VPHLKSAILFAHAVAPALDKRLRGSQNLADAVAKRNIPTFWGNQTPVFLSATLYVLCDVVDCVEQLQDRSPWQKLWTWWVQAVGGLRNKRFGLTEAPLRRSVLWRNIVLILILQNMSPPPTQYYCVIFYFVSWSGRGNMLSGTDVACAANDVALCSINEKNRLWIKEWYKRRPPYIHENLMRDVVLSEPNDFTKIFLWDSTVRHLMGYWRRTSTVGNE